MAPRRRGDQPLVNIVDLRRRLGQQLDVTRTLFLGELEIGTTRVGAEEPVEVELRLESVPAGVSATGTIHAHWTGRCRRCLDEIEGDLDIEVTELFAGDAGDGPPGEAYPLGHETIDLEPLAREQVLLGLPLAPLCGPDCEGPDPEAFPVTIEDPDGPEEHRSGVEEEDRPVDPRWAALDVLRQEFDEP